MTAMPPGTLVPRDWVLDRLSEDIPRVATVETPAPPARVDLTIRELAQLFGKQRSTVRAWVERGDFPAAYQAPREGVAHPRERRGSVSEPPAAGDVRRRTLSMAEGETFVRPRAARNRPEAGHYEVNAR